MALSGIRPWSSRRDVAVTFIIICFLTLMISYRNIFTHRDVGRPLPSFGSSTTKSSPSQDAKAIKASEKGWPLLATITSTVTFGDHAMPTPTTPPISNGCEGFPDTKDILVVMKTGATEAYDKLPIHFLTTLRCVNDTIIFSDMEMDMAGHKVIDVLDEVAEDIKKDNEDFELYALLQEYHRLGEDPRSLKEGNNGWNLDKYKFIHMLLKTYKYRPDVPWYVFLEADTTVVWDNLRTLLNKYDPSKPYYIGSPTYLGIEFGHGGTGYIISGAAMKSAVGKHPDLATKYDKDLHDICCGDAMIGRVLQAEKIYLHRAWPMLNGEKPLTIPFSSSHWCQPVITMHHLTGQEVSQVYNFERERKAEGISTPLLFMDIFNHFVKPSLLPIREDWSNLSDDDDVSPPSDEEKNSRLYFGRKWTELTDIERASPESARNCRKACEANGDCMQWLHHDNSCKTHRSIRLGGSKRSGGSKWTSGWMMDRIVNFQVEMKECQGGIDWTVKPPG